MEKRDLRKWKIMAAVVYAASVSFCAAVCARMSLGKLNMAALGYMHINTMMQTIAVFVIVAGTDISQAQSKAGRAIRSIRNSISECSYGIYLLHIMVISVLWSMKIYWRICAPVISIPLLTLGVTLVSWVIIYAIRKIPGGKHITG
jgi:surface polysaccharide O-acyltransferase-like enzyme